MKSWVVPQSLISLVLCKYLFRVPDTESVEHPILLVMHHWHKDRVGCIHLGGYLGEETLPSKQHHTSIGKPEIMDLTAQHVHLGNQREVTASKKASFPCQVLERAGRYALKWGLGQGCQNSRCHVG